jgi:hypothetical protein
MASTPSSVVAADLRVQATTLDNVAKTLRADADKLEAVTPIPPEPPSGGKTLGQHFGAFSCPLEQVVGVPQSFINQQADYAKDIGVGWWRGDYPPASVSPQKGTFNWGAVDPWVNAALTRGIKPLPILYILPAWMNGGGNDKKPPINDRDYADWCVEAAKHLHGMGVTAIELWNEQNLNVFWAGQPATDDAYRGKYSRMMAAAYPAIKAAVPEMIVIAGGLSTADTVFGATGQPNPPGHGCLSTLKSYADKGLFRNCDAVGWHPYLDTDTPCKDVDIWPSWSPKAVKAAVDIIDAGAPGRGVGLWTTESGCPRSAVGGNQAEQAKRARDAYNAYMPGGCLNQYHERLGPFFWFCIMDRSSGDGREDSFGTVSKSGSKYQIYNDLKTTFTQPWGQAVASWAV